MRAREKLDNLRVGYMMGEGAIMRERSTLVMIHGAGGSSEIWKGPIYSLDEEMNVLALDLPGHGETDGRGYPTISEYAQWLGEILKTLFERPVFLMGHSMGGAIAQEAAIQYPDILKGIILVATGPRLRVAPMFLEGLRNDFEQTVDTMMGYAYSPRTSRLIVEEGARIMKAAGSTAVYNDFLACDQFDSRKDLARINLPCLIICGAEDKLTPPKLSKALNEGVKGSIFKLVPDAGHMVMIEAHGELGGSVREFILRRTS